MRLMEMIRRKGQAFLTGFLVIFLIATFAGLGVGFFNIQLGSGGARGGQPKKSGKLAKLPAMEVNGRKVSEADLNEVLDTVFREAASRASDDPSVALDAYGYVTELMVYQETMLGKAEELDVKVSSEDIAKAKEKDSQSFVAQEEKPASTIVGELGQKLSKVREKNAGFREFMTSRKIGMVVLTDLLSTDLRFKSDSEWKDFLLHYEDWGFARRGARLDSRGRRAG